MGAGLTLSMVRRPTGPAVDGGENGEGEQKDRGGFGDGGEAEGGEGGGAGAAAAADDVAGVTDGGGGDERPLGAGGHEREDVVSGAVGTPEHPAGGAVGAEGDAHDLAEVVDVCGGATLEAWEQWQRSRAAVVGVEEGAGALGACDAELAGDGRMVVDLGRGHPGVPLRDGKVAQGADLG